MMRTTYCALLAPHWKARSHLYQRWAWTWIGLGPDDDEFCWFLIGSGVERNFWSLRNFWPVIAFQLFYFSK